MIENNWYLAKTHDHCIHPGIPEHHWQSEMEQEHLQQLQMTSPSIRRQREYDRQESIPQPNFGGPVNARHMIPMVAGPSAPIQGRINWKERQWSTSRTKWGDAYGSWTFHTYIREDQLARKTQSRLSSQTQSMVVASWRSGPNWCTKADQSWSRSLPALSTHGWLTMVKAVGRWGPFGRIISAAGASKADGSSAKPS